MMYELPDYYFVNLKHIQLVLPVVHIERTDSSGFTIILVSGHRHNIVGANIGQVHRGLLEAMENECD